MKALRSFVALRLAAALLCLLPSLAMAASALPPYRAPTVTADIGSQSERPFGLLCIGQSNNRGQSYDGPTAILGNIWINNAVSGATSFIPAVYGTSPLNGTTPNTSSTTTDPTLSYKSPCVGFANYLRKSGRITANRKIIMVANWYPGQSISNWVGTTPGSFTAGSYFTDLQASLNLASATYPGFKLDFVQYGHGEADTSGTYGSKALYTAAFQTLLAQMRQLPQWSNTANGDSFDTNLTMQELARFADNTQQARNDAISQFANGALDAHVTVTPTFGATETPIAANMGPHYSGTSLMGVIAERHFQAWVQGSLGGGYKPDPQTYHGSAAWFPNPLTISSGTLQLSPDDLKAGAVLTASGGTLSLPDASTVPNGVMMPIYATANVGLSCVTATPCAGGIVTDNNAAGTTPSIGAGNYLLYAVNNRWYVSTLAPRVGGFNFRVVSYTTSAAVALDSTQTRGAISYANGNTITLTAANAGQWYGVFGNPAGAASSLITVDGSATIRTPAGQLVSSYPVPAGGMVMMETIGNFWVVVSDNAPSFTVATLPTCGTAMKGQSRYVTDATAPTYNAALTGGGTVVIPAFCSGSAWTSH